MYYRTAGDVSATTPAEPIAWVDDHQPTIVERDKTVSIIENISGPAYKAAGSKKP
jgi:hypothetical protein